MANMRILATEEMVGYGHATKADTLNRLTMVEHSEAGVHGAAARASMGTAPFVLGADADGDMYYRASSALARLAKGDADKVLGMSDAQVPSYRTLKVTDAGIMTNAGQPAFLVVPTAEQSNIDKDSNVTVVWGTEIFDRAGNFATNTFTAPVTGVYQFNVLIALNNVDQAVYGVTLVTSNRSHGYSFPGDKMLTADSDNVTIAFSVLTDMDAADTAYVTIRQYGGTANQADITTASKFSGFLVC